MTLHKITDERVSTLESMSFEPPVTHVYNPLVYARTAWDAYCNQYGNGKKRVILVGMNPGPFGMSMTNQGSAA